jgi:hypothetical protein
MFLPSNFHIGTVESFHMPEHDTETNNNSKCLIFTCHDKKKNILIKLNYRTDVWKGNHRNRKGCILEQWKFSTCVVQFPQFYFLIAIKYFIFFLFIWNERSLTVNWLIFHLLSIYDSFSIFISSLEKGFRIFSLYDKILFNEIEISYVAGFWYPEVLKLEIPSETTSTLA